MLLAAVRMGVPVGVQGQRHESVGGVDGKVRNGVFGPIRPLVVEQLDGFGLGVNGSVFAVPKALDLLLDLIPIVVNAGAFAY